MRSPFLTGSRARKDDRRAATWLMTVFSIAAAIPPVPAQADERVPPTLIERALQDDVPGRPPSERAIAISTWLPDLRIRAILDEGAWPGTSRLETTLLGELAWPLGRKAPVRDAVAGARDRRQRSAARESLVERIAAAWHARTIADAGDPVAARLAEEEADATIDALVGDGAEDAP